MNSAWRTVCSVRIRRGHARAGRLARLLSTRQSGPPTEPEDTDRAGRRGFSGTLARVGRVWKSPAPAAVLETRPDLSEVQSLKFKVESYFAASTPVAGPPVRG